MIWTFPPASPFHFRYHCHYATALDSKSSETISEIEASEIVTTSSLIPTYSLYTFIVQPRLLRSSINTAKISSSSVISSTLFVENWNSACGMQFEMHVFDTNLQLLWIQKMAFNTDMFNFFTHQWNQVFQKELSPVNFQILSDYGCNSLKKFRGNKASSVDFNWGILMWTVELSAIKTTFIF